MGAVAAVRILHRRKLLEVAPELRARVEAELAAEHERIAGGVEAAVEIGVVDEIVTPDRTRTALAAAIADALAAAPGARGRHGNIPL
jgi:acetyl-CoA/propionyl-CoA carboxylase carboxyl transferase subunit